MDAQSEGEAACCTLLAENSNYSSLRTEKQVVCAFVLSNISYFSYACQMFTAILFYRFRLEKRTEVLSETISSVAKGVTRVVVEIQDTKRQALLKHTRDALSAEVQIRKKWRQLIERLIHER